MCPTHTWGGLVSCDADAEEKVFEKPVEPVTETEVTYAKLLGSEDLDAKEGRFTNNFYSVISKAVNAYFGKVENTETYECAIKFLSNQPLVADPKFIISTEDSPCKAWVEVEEKKGLNLTTLNILIKTNANKFLANENCFDLFSGAISIKEIEFNDVFDTSIVTNMAYMFNSVKATDLDLSNFDTSNVKNMSSMFGNLGNGPATSTLDISNFDTRNVEDFSDMFLTAKVRNLVVGDNFIISNTANTKDYIETYHILQGPKTVLDALNDDAANLPTASKNGWTTDDSTPGVYILFFDQPQ